MLIDTSSAYTFVFALPIILLNIKIHIRALQIPWETSPDGGGEGVGVPPLQTINKIHNLDLPTYESGECVDVCFGNRPSSFNVHNIPFRVGGLHQQTYSEDSMKI